MTVFVSFPRKEHQQVLKQKGKLPHSIAYWSHSSLFRMGYLAVCKSASLARRQAPTSRVGLLNLLKQSWGKDSVRTTKPSGTGIDFVRPQAWAP